MTPTVAQPAPARPLSARRQKALHDPAPRVYDAIPDAVIYSDGSADSRTRIGGWGTNILTRGTQVELWGGSDDTTNNRMEIMGALQGLLYLAPRRFVLVHSDSMYVIRGITEWVHGWQRRGWTKAEDGKPVKNADLWQDLIEAEARHARVEWEWVRGHNGNSGNEHADALAGRYGAGIHMPD